MTHDRELFSLAKTRKVVQNSEDTCAWLLSRDTDRNSHFFSNQPKFEKTLLVDNSQRSPRRCVVFKKIRSFITQQPRKKPHRLAAWGIITMSHIHADFFSIGEYSNALKHTCLIFMTYIFRPIMLL